MNARSKGIVWYLIIAFGLAWSTWELAIRSGVSVLSWQFTAFAIPGAFAPAIAAAVVRKWITHEGFSDAGLSLQVKSWGYYLFAWLLPLIVALVVTAEAITLGLAQPDFSLTRAVANGAAGHDVAGFSGVGPAIIPQLLLTAIVAAPILWGEEFGWRGYLQPRLVTKSPELTAIYTGVIWGVWHWPLTLRGYDFPDRPVLGSVLLVVLAILFSYIFEWLRQKSKTIWTSSLAHASTNTVGGLAHLWFGGAIAPSTLSLLALAPLFVVCIVIFLYRDFAVGGQMAQYEYGHGMNGRLVGSRAAIERKLDTNASDGALSDKTAVH